MKLKLSPDVLALNPYVGETIAVDAEKTSAKQARVPRSDASFSDGFTVLTRERGWSVESPDALQYRLYKINQPLFDTGLCETAALACERARELEKELRR